jgi:DNA polymerase II small subunit/DNA polymerase delta subunit B
MSVVAFESKKNKNDKKHKESLLEIVDFFRKKVEEDQIDEFVITSVNKEGEIEISVCARDFVGAIGMFEAGKHSLLTQQMFDE